MRTKEAAHRSPQAAAKGKETDSSLSESNELIHHDMEANSSDLLPCSSFAVDHALRMSHLGAIWGSCYGPFKAKRLGLSGSSQALYIVSCQDCWQVRALYWTFSCNLFSFNLWNRKVIGSRETGLILCLLGLLLGQLLVLEPGNGKKFLLLQGFIVHFIRSRP